MNYDAPDWPADMRARFEKYVSGGGGLVIVHAADNAFPNWPAFNEMAGIGGWRNRNQKGRAQVVFQGWQAGVRSHAGTGGAHGERLPFQVTTRAPSIPSCTGCRRCGCIPRMSFTASCAGRERT